MINQTHRIVLIDLVSPYQNKETAHKNLGELKSLVSTYRGVSIEEVIQHRERPDKATFIGSGKVEELVEIVANKKIDIVVINAIVNLSVLFNLTEKLWTVKPNIQVWDRVDLILNIFDKHALTTEAKLQIEIARMQHMGPRVYGLGVDYFSRQAGGIGTRGGGETNIELMKRHWRDRIKKKTEQLEKLTAQRKKQLEQRQDNNVPTIAIVGYTNAGKTSLFNALTKKKKIAKDALFATLDSVTGRIYLPAIEKEVVVSDTIGFIKDLPASLIESFKSTLMESVYADVLLHIVDISDPEMKTKIRVVEEILHDIGAKAKKIIFVFNKIDAFAGDAEQILADVRKNFARFNPQFISVTTDYGLDKLKAEIGQAVLLL